MPPEKRCARCGLVKPHSEFWRDRAKRDGLDCSCKSCRKVRREQARQNRPRKPSRYFFDGINKECTGCHQIKSVSEFYVNPTYSTGYEGKCKACLLERRRARRRQVRPPKPQRFFDGIRRECTKCGQILPVSEFHRDRTNRSGYSTWCKACRKAARGHEHGTYTPEFKQALIDLLGGACALCGFNQYRTALQFHHVNPADKDILVSKLLKRYREICPEVETELDKCCLLCANCHHALHASEIEVGYSRRERIGWNAQLVSNS